MSGPILPTNIHRIERVQTLEPGQYWRAITDIPEEGIEAQTVLLLQSIRLVDELPHTIILRPHPLKYGTPQRLTFTAPDGSVKTKIVPFNEHRFLVANFLGLFVFEPDHERIRQAEIDQIYQKVTNLQAEMENVSSKPQFFTTLLAQEIDLAQLQLPVSLENISLEALSVNIDHNLTAGALAQLRQSISNEQKLAETKTTWLKTRADLISKTLTTLTPFFEEKAVAALSATDHIQSYIKELQTGIETLDLYVGTNVEVITIQQGSSAPPGPITVMQQKLIMDEELSVHIDIDESFDFTNTDSFFNALRKHKSLVDQIFPTQRCVVSMATTRRFINYGDVWVDDAYNTQNRMVFLLVRDGENLYQIFSPIESHLRAERLFPSKTEIDKIFQTWKGQTISFEDISYTDCLELHDQRALHYKRFLILLCGLDHRLKLFGKFCPDNESSHFLSPQFQSRYFNFIYDLDGSNFFESERKPEFTEWLREKNQYLRSGVRVYCQWHTLLTDSTTPTLFKPTLYNYGTHRIYHPQEEGGVAVVFESQGKFMVEVQVTGRGVTTGEIRTFSCKVDLSTALKEKNLSFLVLDTVQIEELSWYLGDRKNRKNFLNYVQLCKGALQILRQEESAEKEVRFWLLSYLTQLEPQTNTPSVQVLSPEILVAQSVIAWRSFYRGKNLPSITAFDSSLSTGSPDVKNLLTHLTLLKWFSESSKAVLQQINQITATKQLTPLRFSLRGDGKFILYAAAKIENQDNRLVPHSWVYQFFLYQTKTGFREIDPAKGKWVQLPIRIASETTLYEWPELQEWCNRVQYFESMAFKQEVFNRFNDFIPASLDWLTQPQLFKQLFEDWKLVRQNLMEISSLVVNPTLVLPFGICCDPTLKTNHASQKLTYLCVEILNPHHFLFQYAPDSAHRVLMMREFCRPYQNQITALDCLKGLDYEFPYRLVECSVIAFNQHSRFLVPKEGDHRSFISPLDVPDSCTFSLNDWLSTWQQTPTAQKKLIWIPDFLKNAQGFCLDEIFKISPVDKTELVTVYQNQIGIGSDLTGLSSWIDICKIDSVPRHKIKNIWHKKVSLGSFQTLSIAMDYLRLKFDNLAWLDTCSATQSDLHCLNSTEGSIELEPVLKRIFFQRLS